MRLPVRSDDVVTAAEVLWDSAQRFPETPAVTDLDHAGGQVTLSYEQLRSDVASLAGAFTELGVGVGDRVALLLHNSRAYIESYLAAVAAGMIVVPLNTRLLDEDYEHMLRDSGAQILVTTGEFLERAPSISALPGMTIIRADAPGSGPCELDRLARDADPVEAPVKRDQFAPASLMYTSGTTGLPKAVVLSDRSWWAISERTIEVLGMHDGEVTLHVAPLTHGAGFLMLPTLRLGGLNLVCESFSGARTLQLINDYAVTGVFLVPSMIRMLLDAWSDESGALPSLRRIYYAGSPIDPTTFREAVIKLDGRLVQSFAQMESPMFFTALDEEDHRRAVQGNEVLIRSAGRVLQGVELRIVDDDGHSLPHGEAGEVVAKAPQTMNGYWNRPDATAAALADGWLHTGDIGYLDEGGYLFVVDRKKDMIVTGGSNVYAREVEEALLEIPEIKEAAVIGTPHRIWGEAVTAVLVPAGGERDTDSVIDACREKLAGYRVPKRVEWVESLPRNAYGKVLKRQLRDRFDQDELKN